TLGIRGPRFYAGVLVPAALPGIATGLKLGFSFAWRALMAAELLFVAGGLGQLLEAGRELLDAAQVMGVMACIVALGVFGDQALAFRAGPAAMEALLAGEVDVCYVGPGPAAIAYLRSGGEALRVIAGAVSGGAVLVARSARSPRDLEGKAVATPQLGNTQDIA